MEKAGVNSGALARVLPVLAYDREMIRLQHERLVSYTFSLDGLKEAFGILEAAFSNATSDAAEPPLIIEFSTSVLMKNYRSTNNLLTSGFRRNGLINVRSVLSTLLDQPPPDTDTLLEEGSGVGQIKVFLAQTIAEFSSLDNHPGTNSALAGLENNLLRVASDFFWASYICGFLTPHGVLVTEEKTRLEESIKAMLLAKSVVVPDTIIEPLIIFMRYTIIGAAHLNTLTSEGMNANPVLEHLPAASLKRKRIIERLALGLTRDKKRRFPLSRVKEALGRENSSCVEDQVTILESHSIVVRPTNRTVQLVRAFSALARNYMVANCALTDADVVSVERNAALLTD